MRLLIGMTLLALAGCGGDDDAGAGGGDGAQGGGATCTQPGTPMPSPRLLSAEDEGLETSLGVVVRSEGLELEIDTCFAPDADCVPTPVTLRMDDGLGLTVPVGALVRVELTANPSQMGFGNGDPTPTAKVTNVASAEGFDNPIASDDRLWFYSSPAWTPAAPGIETRLETICTDGGTTHEEVVSDLVVTADEGEVRFVEGDVRAVTLQGAEHEVSFLGAWYVAAGFCRWQVARREP